MHMREHINFPCKRHHVRKLIEVRSLLYLLPVEFINIYTVCGVCDVRRMCTTKQKSQYQLVHTLFDVPNVSHSIEIELTICLSDKHQKQG